MTTQRTVPAALAMFVLAGCSVAARSPESYRDATRGVLESKNDEIRACYDGVLRQTPGVGGSVTVTFDVETEKGQLTNVRVDKAKTTAPPEVADCVTKSIRGLALTPPDERMGQGTWVYEFAAPAGAGKG